MIKITVDNNEIETEENLSILQACLNNGIYIPNLCYMSDMKEPPGACRLCFVEVEGFSQPVPSCTVKVKEGMIVKTDTEQVKHYREPRLNSSFLFILWTAKIALLMESASYNELQNFFILD